MTRRARRRRPPAGLAAEAARPLAALGQVGSVGTKVSTCRVRLLCSRRVIRSGIGGTWRFYRPDPRLAPQITAGDFLAAAADSGDSPADDPEELRSAFNAERVQADRVLQDLVLRARPAGGRRDARGCRRVTSAQPLELPVRPGALVVRSDRPARVALRLRRFGDGFDNPPSPLDVGPAGIVIDLAADRSRAPYLAQIAPASGSVTVCAG